MRTLYTIVTNDEYELPVKCDATAQECAEWLGTTKGNIRNMAFKRRKKGKYNVIISGHVKGEKKKTLPKDRSQYFHDRYAAIKNGTWKTIVLLLVMATIYNPAVAIAKEPELNSVWLTCYLPTGNPTASGTAPRRGIMAGKREWIGKTAIIYERNGDKVGSLIGIYEIADTGTDPTRENHNGTE